MFRLFLEGRAHQVLEDPVGNAFPTDLDVGDDVQFEQCGNSIARVGKEGGEDVCRLGTDIGRLCGKHSAPTLMLMM